MTIHCEACGAVIGRAEMYARGEEGYEHIDYRDPVWADNYGGEYNGADYCAGCHYNIVMTDDCLP